MIKKLFPSHIDPSSFLALNRVKGKVIIRRIVFLPFHFRQQARRFLAFFLPQVKFCLLRMKFNHFRFHFHQMLVQLWQRVSCIFPLSKSQIRLEFFRFFVSGIVGVNNIVFRNI